MKEKKKSFDSYSKKPLKDEVRKAMNRYFNQLDQKNTPINVYNLVLKEVEPPLLNSVMKFCNNNPRRKNIRHKQNNLKNKIKEI